MGIQYIRPSGSRTSQVVAHGGLVWLAGQAADDTSEDVAEQIQQSPSKIDALLAEAKTARHSISSSTIWLVDHHSFAATHEVWDVWCQPGQVPTYTCVEPILAFSPCAVEIVIVATVGGGPAAPALGPVAP